MIRRKGTSLIELLVMIALLVSLMAALTPLFGGLIKNTPQLYNDSAANMQLSKILRQVRLDALAAQTVRINDGAETNIFTIAFAASGQMIYYTYDPAKEMFTRREIFNDGTTIGIENSWSLVNAAFSGEVKKHERGQLLIIHCGFKRRCADVRQLSLANTHVFCIGAQNREVRP